MLKRLTVLILVIVLSMAIFPTIVSADPAIRIKDIARLQGIRSNQLSGMGLIVGLNGTGDSSKVDAQLVANAIAKWGGTINAADFKSKNLALVIITANLPPYLHQGDTMDVQVSSIGDAKSLQGGILLQSPLSGADGKVYAVAQGSVYVGGYSVGDKGSLQQKNITTVGTVPQGAIVEREVPMQLDVNGKLRWALNHPDFTTSSRLAQTINDNIAAGVARPVDMGLVEVLVPLSKQADPVTFIAEIEALSITPDGIAKVIINERTGTIVIGEKVRVASVAVTHRNIIVKINTPTAVSQPNAFSLGQTTVTAEPQVQVNEEQGRLVLLPEGTNIGAIVRALNAVGSTPQDIIAIVVAIKQAGALYGVLEFV